MGSRGAVVTAAMVLTALSASLWGPLAQAQDYPITPAQQATASQVAQNGVPLSALAPNAPGRYTVKSGDTLWAISGLFLTTPWRWPELWGMNQQEIRNPHRIYPGQQLLLLKKDGRAMLLAGQAQPNDGVRTVRLSPRTRIENLGDNALPTLQTNLIEPFLAEPLIVDENTLALAPRIVATADERILLSRGDRAYVRGPLEAPLLDGKDKPWNFRVMRQATPLRDPVTKEVLGYETQYVGKVVLVKGESRQPSGLLDKNGQPLVDIVPATVDIQSIKEEISVGDRLLPEPERELLNFVPRAPSQNVDARIVSVYGSTSIANAAQYQIVVINKGTKDGIERGHVLSLLSAGANMVDSTDATKTRIQLPDEQNGLLMVFRPFERLSYGLILEIKTGVKIGDRLTTPH
ncbi:LysM peptidoglycan-binding domain-containing protein [Rhodoferax sp.]|uniref:LysM peptidoglycan-binding domain-containing protein n=2 Tax=Rhodoferax sp. TaxID=50421 RepID=UPI003264E7CB